VAEGDGLLNADQHFGHRRFSQKIHAFQSLRRSSDLAAVGSGSPVLGAGRDNFRDSSGDAVVRLAPVESWVHRRFRDADATSRPARGILSAVMDTVPVKPERLAQLEEFARRRGRSTADALDDVLADYLEWERQDYQEAVEGIRQGYEDVKAGRTKSADQFLDDFARKHGLPR
jgi:hypothetical protein